MNSYLMIAQAIIGGLASLMPRRIWIRREASQAQNHGRGASPS